MNNLKTDILKTVIKNDIEYKCDFETFYDDII